MKSRQTKAFEEFAETFIKLIEGARDVPHKQEVLAWWGDFFEHAGVKDNMIQAFSNFMWTIDQQIEDKVNEELRALLTLLPNIADADDPNTQAISWNLKNIIQASETPVGEFTDMEVDALVSDDEVDDSRPAGL